MVYVLYNVEAHINENDGDNGVNTNGSHRSSSSYNRQSNKLSQILSKIMSYRITKKEQKWMWNTTCDQYE